MSAEPTLLAPVADEPAPSGRSILRRLLTNVSVLIGGVVLVVMTLIALLAPQLGTVDPTAIDPVCGTMLDVCTNTGRCASSGSVNCTTGLKFRSTMLAWFMLRE